VYVSDSIHHSIERIDRHGQVTILAGTGTPGFGGDGGRAASDHAIRSDQADAAVPRVSDMNVALLIHRQTRRRVELHRDHCGSSAFDFDGDGGPALSAALNTPVGLAVNAAGDVCIADYGNNRIRKLTPAPVAANQSAAFTIANAASMPAGPVAPGEMVTVFGSGIGPATPVAGTLDASSVLGTEVAFTKVVFGAITASIFEVRGSQIRAQIPYEIASRIMVDVEVFYQGKPPGKGNGEGRSFSSGDFHHERWDVSGARLE
jgi:hypothetical protein